MHYFEPHGNIETEPVGGIIFLRLLPLRSLHLAMRFSIFCREPGINGMHFHPFDVSLAAVIPGLPRNLNLFFYYKIPGQARNDVLSVQHKESVSEVSNYF